MHNDPKSKVYMFYELALYICFFSSEKYVEIKIHELRNV